MKINEPLNEFVNCHGGILAALAHLEQLPGLLAAAESARKTAQESEQLFSNGVLEHHAEEERDLFPAVLRSAQEGDERDAVQVQIARLTSEHRAVEALWLKLAPGIKAAAKGKTVEGLNPQLLAELIRMYRAHALFEEQEFLPKAKAILSRNSNDMEALGLTMHMRHVKVPAAYI